MTYKLNSAVRKIVSPITLSLPDENISMTFHDGAALAAMDFGKNYQIVSLAAERDSVVIVARENDSVNIMNWIGEEAVAPSFF